MTPVKRRALARFARAERSPVRWRRSARGAARELLGGARRRSAREVALLRGVRVAAGSWSRRHAALSGRAGRLRIDARPPTSLTPVPGRTRP